MKMLPAITLISAALLVAACNDSNSSPSYSSAPPPPTSPAPLTSSDVTHRVVSHAAPLSAADRAALGLKTKNSTETAGVVVVGFAALAELASPSDTSRLQFGDVITSFNHVAIRTVDDLQKAVAELMPGTSTIAVVKRGSGFMEVPLAVGMAHVTAVPGAFDA